MLNQKHSYLTFNKGGSKKCHQSSSLSSRARSNSCKLITYSYFPFIGRTNVGHYFWGSRNFCPDFSDIYTPRGGHIDPSWWIYRSITVSIYTYHDEYIALLSSLKKLNALKALPPGYNLFSQGVFFSAFSRYRLPARRLRIKLSNG